MALYLTSGTEANTSGGLAVIMQDFPNAFL